MDSASTVSGPELSQRWWEETVYSTGQLVIPDRSILGDDDRTLLETIAMQSDKCTLNLPVMPAAAIRCLNLLKHAEVDTADVSDALEQDPTLAAWILKHVNSPLYGVRHPIDNLQHAIGHIGLKRLHQIILEVVMRQATAGINNPSYAEMEWSFALKCGSLARALGKLAGLDSDACYLAGLLHDVGRLPVLAALAQHNVLISPHPDSPAEVILETLHRGVGLQIAEEWMLPPMVKDAIGSHLTGRMPGEESLSRFPSTQAAEAAGDLCIALGAGRFHRPFNVLECPALQALGLQENQLIEFFEKGLPKLMG